MEAKTKQKWIGFMVFSFIAIAVVVGVAADINKAELAPQQATQTSTATAATRHHYVMREKGKWGYEYGYEEALSEDARRAGQVAEKVLMVRYHGEKDDVYQLSSEEGDFHLVIECQKPCEFFKQSIWDDHQRVTTERMRLAEGTIAWAMMQDARNGFLEPTSTVQNGKKMRAWVSEKGPHWELAR